MTVIHTSTRATLGLSATAPSAVTTYSFQYQPAGVPFAVTQIVTDGTNGNDTIAAATNGQYVFGFGGNDRISNQSTAAVLLGGEGADTFVIYNNVNLAGAMDGAVLDFEVGTDSVDLSNFGITAFSQLVITPNSSGTPGTFAQVTSTDGALTLNLSGLGGLNNLTAASFGFSGTTPVGPVGPTPPAAAFPVPTFTLPDLTALFTVTGVNTVGTSAGTTINGSALADLLYGSSLNDSLDGGDTIFGGAGGDQIYGAAGNDVLYGGDGVVSLTDGNDTIYGGAGADTIYGNAGNDILIGGGGVNDTADGADVLIGGAGNDLLLGNGGNDRLFGLTGDDTLAGGVGDDTYYFGFGNGDDLVVGFEGAGVAGGDTLSFLSGVFATAQAALAAVTYSNGAAQFNLGNGDTVTLTNIAANSLTAGDISIVNEFTFS